MYAPWKYLTLQPLRYRYVYIHDFDSFNQFSRMVSTKRKATTQAKTSKASAPAKKIKKDLAECIDIGNVNSIPTNTTMPEQLTFENPPETQIKIATWNVNSLMASLKKGAFHFHITVPHSVTCTLNVVRI
jgi:hypothetical protein